MTTIVHCYVGCKTESEDRPALHVLECDTVTGAAKLVQSVKDVQGTSYFQLDGDNRYLYSAIGEQRGDRSGSVVVRFPVASDGRLGTMERLAALPCETPCHVSLTADGKRIAFAAYLSATAGTVGIDGRDLRTYVFPDDAMGSNGKRQKKAHAHFTFATPDERRLGVTDLGCDRIRFFDPVTMAPDLPMDIRLDSGDGPRHAVWSKDGRFLFVVNELSSTVTSHAYGNSRFSLIGKWSMLPPGFDRWATDRETLATTAAAIKLTADGKILMASNRGHDSIAFYEVRADGTLALRNIAGLAGRFPRDFELVPDERFMIVGHKMSNEIRVYRFNRASCALTPVGAPIPVWRPSCFKFADSRSRRRAEAMSKKANFTR